MNYAYSDSGLFGFHIVTGKDEVGKVLHVSFVSIVSFSLLTVLFICLF